MGASRVDSRPKVSFRPLAISELLGSNTVRQQRARDSRDPIGRLNGLVQRAFDLIWRIEQVSGSEFSGKHLNHALQQLQSRLLAIQNDEEILGFVGKTYLQVLYGALENSVVNTYGVGNIRIDIFFYSMEEQFAVVL